MFRTSSAVSRLLGVLVLATILVGSTVGYLVLQPTGSELAGSGEDWLTGWGYRKRHVINAAAGAGTNYQIRITVYYGTGTDSGENVYLNNHSRTDFGDVRFTAADHITLLDYWMESYTTSTSAVFWVEVADDLSTTAQTIYMYYGNSTVTTTSNGSATFMLYEDWDGTPTGWTSYNGANWVSGTYTDDGSPALPCRYNKRTTAGSTGGESYWWKAITKQPSQGLKIIENTRVLIHSTSGVYRWLCIGWIFDAVGVSKYSAYLYYNTVAGTDSGWQANTEISSITEIQGLTSLRVAFGSYWANGWNWGDLLEARHDRIRVRAYVNPEPSHGAWGSEDIPATDITRVQGNVRGTTTSNSISITLGSTPINGNVLVATIATYGSSLVIVNSINQTGVTWTSQISQTRSIMGGEIWFGVVGSGASTSITINLSGTANNGAVADICEYSGIATSNFLDKTATGSGTGTFTSTGSTATTTQANELWIGITFSDTTTQSSPTNGFTLLDGALYSGATNAYLEKIVSSTGSAYSGTTIVSHMWGGCIATFKAFVNAAPTNDACTLSAGSIATGVVGANIQFTIQTKHTDVDGPTNMNYTSIQIDSAGWSAIFNWTEATDTFTETSDPNSYFTLSSTSADSSYSGNQWTLNWKLIITSWTTDENNKNIALYAKDDSAATDSDTYSNVFRVENDLVPSSLTVNDYRCNPSGPTYLIDSYSEPNQSANRALTGLFPTTENQRAAGGQCFQCVGGNYKLAFGQFYLYKAGSPTGTAYAKLYAMTGTYGSSGKPTGNPLATSDGFDVSTLPTGYQLITFTFSGTEQYAMTENAYYVIVFTNPTSGTIDTNNFVLIGSDTTSPTHAGNYVKWFAGAWSEDSNEDCCFYVYVTLTGTQTLTFSGYLYYEGTGIPPPDGDYHAQIKLSGVQKGSIDTTLVNGQFSINDVAAESTVGSYSYTVETTHMESAGSFSAVIVDQIKITACGIVDNTIDVDAGGKVWYLAIYEYDGAPFNSTCGTLSLNYTTMTWENNHWTCTFPYSMSGSQTVFHITSVTDLAYGLTGLNNVAGDLVLNWATMQITIQKP